MRRHQAARIASLRSQSQGKNIAVRPAGGGAERQPERNLLTPRNVMPMSIVVIPSDSEGPVHSVLLIVSLQLCPRP
jgi:hypothetical protein